MSTHTITTRTRIMVCASIGVVLITLFTGEAHADLQIQPEPGCYSTAVGKPFCVPEFLREPLPEIFGSMAPSSGPIGTDIIITGGFPEMVFGSNTITIFPLSTETPIALPTNTKSTVPASDELQATSLSHPVTYPLNPNIFAEVQSSKTIAEDGTEKLMFTFPAELQCNNCDIETIPVTPGKYIVMIDSVYSNIGKQSPHPILYSEELVLGKELNFVFNLTGETHNGGSDTIIKEDPDDAEKDQSNIHGDDNNSAGNSDTNGDQGDNDHIASTSPIKNGNRPTSPAPPSS